MSKRRSTLVVIAALVAASLGASAGSAATAPPRLRHDGRWLVDDQGRVVMLHGMNAVWKHAPYVAPDTATGFTTADADFLVANGFNAVRLGVLFAGVMPQPGVIDTAYLDKIDRIVQLLSERQIYVLLDFHQDDYTERFTGEGFPDWAVHDDGAPFADTGTFFSNYFTPALMRTFDNLYANAGGVRDSYAAGWRAVAARFSGAPYLMGYDLLNEPSAGMHLPTCFNPAGCPVFDAILQGFFDAVRTEIRKTDPNGMVWYEPQFLFNAISRSSFGHIDDPQVGLGWHDYACLPAFTGMETIPGDPDCVINEPMVMANAEAQATAMGAATLLTEFGSNDNVTDLARLTSLADQNQVGWIYWAYKAWDDPTGNPAAEGLFAKDDDLSTLKAPKADVLIQPYAQAIAGTPLSSEWDGSAKSLTVRYAPKAGLGDTEVFVPSRHYPTGWAADVTGGRIVSRTANRVIVRSDAGAGDVSIVVHPGTSAGPPPIAVDQRPPLASTGSDVTWPLAALVFVAIGATLRAWTAERSSR